MSIVAPLILVTGLGYHEGPRPPLAPRATRISNLTPSGIYLGQRRFDVLALAPLGSGVFTVGGAPRK